MIGWKALQKLTLLWINVIYMVAPNAQKYSVPCDVEKNHVKRNKEALFTQTLKQNRHNLTYKSSNDELMV